MNEKFSHLPLDWQRAITAFLEDRESRSGSIASRKVTEMHLAHFFADHPDPANVTRNDVGSFLRKPQTRRNPGQPVSASMKNGRRAALSQFYAYASEYEIRPGVMLFALANPCRSFHDVKPGQPDKGMSQEQVTRFFAAIPRDTVKGKRDFSLMLFYYLSARRRSELQRLRVRDIEEVIFMDGTTRRVGHRFTFRGKGRSRIDDHQELPALVYDALLDYWKASGRYDTLRADDPLWSPIYHGEKRGAHTLLAGCYIAELFRDYRDAAGLPSHLSLHSLRHASAAERARQGEDIFSISKTLRHSSLAITTRYLQGLVSESDQGAALLANLPFLASGSEAKR